MNDSNSPTARYVADVKKAAGFSQYTTARLQVSVGGPNHEGAKLDAMVQWLKARFAHTIICVNDTLQSHNLRFEKGLPAPMSLTLTRGYGDQWVARHKHILDQLPRYTIRRWDSVMSHPHYGALLQDIISLYDSKEDMASAINSVVAEFWERRCKRIGFVEDFRLPMFQKHSRDYLLEELAAFVIMFGQENAADVYPGSIRLPFHLVEKYLPDAAPAGFGTKVFTHLSFLRQGTAQQA